MNRTRILKNSLLIVIVLAMLIGAVVVVQGMTLNSSAASRDVTRQPRPHPKSHLSATAAPNGLDDITRSPRPHPKSHVEMPVDQP